MGNVVEKVWWKSKTMILNFIVAVAGVATFVLPGASDWVTAHQTAILTGLGVLGMILRAVTKGAVVLEE